MVVRASKHHDHVHTFHRSTSSVGLAGADGEFPVTHYVFPLLCGFFLVSGHPSGPRLAASRWVEASYRWSGFDLGLGGEECGSG